MKLGRSARLLISREPFPDESFMGYILGLTEQNAYETPSWILRMSGVRHKQLHQSCFITTGRYESLTPLAQLIGIGVGDLAQLTYLGISRSGDSDLYDFFSQPVRHYLIRPDRPKICPECLSESQYCRRIWEFSAVATCPTHRRRLINECPKCKKRISWSRRSVVLCPCKFDWRESPAISVSEQELKLSRHIHQLCGVSASIGNRRRFSGPASKLSLNDFLTALFFVAGQSKGISSATSKKLAAKGADRNFHGLLTEAFSVFEDWPNNYFRFLKGRAAQEKGVPRTHQRLKSPLYRDFGSFYSGLHGVLSGAPFNFMRSAFIEYVTNNWSAGCNSTLEFCKATGSVQGNQYVLKSDVRGLLGADPRWLDEQIARGRLRSVVRSKGKRRLIFIDVSGLSEILLSTNS